MIETFRCKLRHLVEVDLFLADSYLESRPIRRFDALIAKDGANSKSVLFIFILLLVPQDSGRNHTEQLI